MTATSYALSRNASHSVQELRFSKKKRMIALDDSLFA